MVQTLEVGKDPRLEPSEVVGGHNEQFGVEQAYPDKDIDADVDEGPQELGFF